MKLVMPWPCADCGAALFTEVDAWYRAYAPQLRRQVGRFAAERGVPPSALDPEDVVHDAFELLQTRLAHDDVRNPAGWLRKVAERYVARAHGELRRVAGGDAEDHLIESLAATWSSLARTADLDTIVEYRAALAAIAALPDRQRAVVYLQRIQGMSHGEIAERLGIAAATVSVHAHRGVRSIREALGEELDLQQAMGEHMRSQGMLLGPRWAAWTWCPCWRSLPKERSYADEVLSLDVHEVLSLVAKSLP
jgi:RNA polymerase sigma factor (sigma-70 family)